ncbi:methanol utilization control sensor protein moxY [Salinisphaera dokdonensis CL-ES53]|uniref:Oxygen sensor histidine kinase NreB n=2 Tax=Salinisphaera TaxID=180541 RepID=A0ABV2AZS2_9GAMM
MIAVTLLLAAILLAAGWLVIHNAQRAIAEEMDSSVALASDLVETSIRSDGEALAAAKRLAAIGHLRHLCLSLVPLTGDGGECPAGDGADAPAWFAAMTRPNSLPNRRIVVAPDYAIHILADPDDEIEEAWQDTRGLLALLLVFYGATIVIVYRLLGRAIVPVQRIDAALARIEHGDYAIRLPHFSLPEFDGIAAQFNHMAETLAAARSENQRLREHSLRIQEDERRSLARELHDELGQSLTAIRADAAGILARRERLPDGVAESAEAIAEVAARIYDQTRLMMRRLRPPGLDELGLDAALEEHIAGWQRTHPAIEIAYTGDDTLSDLPSPAAIHVFRLVQEALTNALRHGQPKRIDVALGTSAGRLRLTITDDGRGFDPAARRPGLGLSGMSERIDLLAGQLHIDSSPGGGTRVRADIPLV